MSVQESSVITAPEAPTVLYNSISGGQKHYFVCDQGQVVKTCRQTPHTSVTHTNTWRILIVLHKASEW